MIGEYLKYLHEEDGFYVLRVPRGTLAFADVYSLPRSYFLPEEAEWIKNAVPNRQEEFLTVRACARKAMHDLGCGIIPMLTRNAAPKWPEGVTGSLSHCACRCAAVACKDKFIQSVGIDIECNQWLNQVVRSIALTEEERRLCDKVSLNWPHVAWDAMVFSAKESVYKMLWQYDTAVTLDQIGVSSVDCAGASFGSFWVTLHGIPFLKGTGVASRSRCVGEWFLTSQSGINTIVTLSYIGMS